MWVNNGIFVEEVAKRFRLEVDGGYLVDPRYEKLKLWVTPWDSFILAKSLGVLFARYPDELPNNKEVETVVYNLMAAQRDLGIWDETPKPKTNAIAKALGFEDCDVVTGGNHYVICKGHPKNLKGKESLFGIHDPQVPVFWEHGNRRFQVVKGNRFWLAREV